MKPCPKCGETIDDPKRSYCRKCSSEYMCAWYANRTATNKEIIYLKKYRMLSSARKRAIKREVIFDISLVDIHIPNLCPALGIKLSLNNRSLGFNSPTLDCLRPELGYIVGNISVISSKANIIKSNASTSEVKKVLDWMIKKGL